MSEQNPSPFDLYQNFFAAQMKMAKDFQANLQPAAGAKAEAFELWEQLYKKQIDWSKNMFGKNEGGSGLFGAGLDFTKLSEALKTVAPPASAFFDQWSFLQQICDQAQKLFGQLYNHESFHLWQDSVEKWSLELGQSFIRAMPSQISVPLPNGQWIKLDPFSNLFTSELPWMEHVEAWAQKQPVLLDRLMKGDLQAVAEEYQVWWDSFKQAFAQGSAFGKVGLNREANEQIALVFESQGEYGKYLLQYQLAVLSCILKSLEEFGALVGKSAVDGAEPHNHFESLQAFQKGFFDILERNLDKLFKSPAFSELQGEHLKAYLKLKSSADKLLASAFKASPLATKQDLDETNRELYLLKKEVHALRKLAGGIATKAQKT